MYKIGEFSALSKTTIKTLRYYEKEGLLIPSYVDDVTGYRFYETSQLIDLSKILSLRQLGMSIDNIKDILNGNNTYDLLEKKKEELKLIISVSEDQLSRINYLMKGKDIMKYEVVVKTLPEYTVYYKEGVISSFADIVQFILSSAEECRAINPDIKCIEPDYCYVSYLDGEYKEKDIKVRYAQAVTKEGVSDDNIKFEKLKPLESVCIYHKGLYSTIREAYSFGIKWIEDNGYEIIEPIRERYIDGMWNKENEEDWLTEIQIPVSKKN